MSTVADRDAVMREVGLDELDHVMIVMKEAFDPEYGEAWSRSQCAGILEQSGVWISLSCVADVPVGFAMARMIADEAELLLIGVRPNFRGEGYGSQLVDRVLVTAAASGAVKLHLEVREGNLAEHLYRNRGFTPVGRRCSYYQGRDGRKYDAITLSAFLTGKDD